MKRTLFIMACWLACPLFAYEITGVKVSGNSAATVSFTGSEGGTLPSWGFHGNTIEMTFSGATLADALHGRLDLDSPNVLLSRVSLYDGENKSVKALLVLNGSLEKLKDRLHVARGTDGVTLTIDYPKADNGTLALLREEQQPILLNTESVKKAMPRVPGTQIFLALLVCAFAGVAAYFLVRFLRSKGQWKGTRKYLIESLSHFPLGPKTGVSLLKVGNEFVLVGVTPNQVTFLSHLPKLQQQYDEEAQFDRGVFKEAVEEEMSKQKSYHA